MHRRMHRRCRTCPAVSLVHGYGGSYVGDVPATTNFPVPQVRACARALLLLHAIAGGKPPHTLYPRCWRCAACPADGLAATAEP